MFDIVNMKVCMAEIGKWEGRKPKNGEVVSTQNKMENQERPLIVLLIKSIGRSLILKNQQRSQVK